MTTAHARFEQIPDALHVEVAHRGRRTLVTVRGELDLATAPELERTLTAQAHHHGPLLLDLRDVSFIDATGVGVLLRAAAAARRRTDLQLIPGDAVIRLLELCRLRAHFSYTDPPPD